MNCACFYLSCLNVTFGFFPLFPFAKIIVSLHISSSSTLTACPPWQGNNRVCWEIRMGKDEFPRTPLSAGCPLHALLFDPQVRFCYWVLCVLPSFCQCLCPGADHTLNLQLRLFPSLQAVSSPPSPTLRFCLRLYVLREASSHLSSLGSSTTFKVSPRLTI